MKRVLWILLALMLLVPCAAPALEAGDTLLFGSYEQDNNLSNGKEPIEWVVVDRDEEGVMLMSVKCLDAHYYHKKFIPMTWDRCDLRGWLNGEFLNEAFSEAEQEYILTTHVVNNKLHGNPGGEDTEDKVYLLSYAEAMDHYPELKQRVAWPTEYCVARGCYVDPKTGACWWWLRSPGVRPIDASGVRVDGRISGYGSRDVYRPSGAIRPVIRVKPEVVK